MLKFPPVFVQKILCFVQISKSFVQKHETITAETGQHPEENSSKRADKSELVCPQNKTIEQIK